jgi:hypothetical protein
LVYNFFFAGKIPGSKEQQGECCQQVKFDLFHNISFKKQLLFAELKLMADEKDFL